MSDDNITPLFGKEGGGIDDDEPIHRDYVFEFTDGSSFVRNGYLIITASFAAIGDHGYILAAAPWTELKMACLVEDD